MKDIDLQKVWKTMDSEINNRSREEMDLLLESKAQQTINRDLKITWVSITTCIGLLIFLTVTALNRQNDLIYVVNNIILGLLTVISLITGLLSWRNMRNKKYNQPLKEWLKVSIKSLSVRISGKFSYLYRFVIPILYLLTVLSIHVYFEEVEFVEVLKNEESLFGLIFSLPIGLFVAYYFTAKIRKTQLNHLHFLKDLYQRLSKLH